MTEYSNIIFKLALIKCLWYYSLVWVFIIISLLVLFNQYFLYF